MVKKNLLRRQIRISFFLFSCILYVSACGKEGDGGIGERLSGPAAISALPMRAEVTVTPTVGEPAFEIAETPTPEATQPEQSESAPDNPADEEQRDRVETEEAEPSELEARLSLMNSDLQEPLAEATPTPSAERSAEEPEDTQATAPPTPSVTPTPSPEPTPVPEKPAPTPEAAPQKKSASAPSKTQEVHSQEEEDESRSAAVKKKKKNTPATSKKESATQRASKINLDELVVCSALSNRTPVGTDEQFSYSKVKQVYTWMKISGATPPMRVKHHYYREGKLVASVSLRIKYPAMRTWSQKTFKGAESAGDWKVVVTTEDGSTILAEREFTLTP